jgi:hypothetical protein
VNRIGNRTAGREPLGYQVTLHAHQIVIASIIEADDGIDRYSGKHAFHDHGLYKWEVQAGSSLIIESVRPVRANPAWV